MEWVKSPDSEGWWWHVYDEFGKDKVPFMYSIMQSNSGKEPRFFVAYPYIRWIEDVGGLWAKAIAPPLPKLAEQRTR